MGKMKFYEMPEVEEKLNVWFDESIEKQKKMKDIIINIMSDPYYIEWLKEFSKDKDKIDDDEWLAEAQFDLSESDKRNIGNLYLLYDALDIYGDINRIKTYPCDLGNYYRVKYDDFCFDMGNLIGGMIFYVKKAPIESDKQTIDFNDFFIERERNKELEDITKKILRAYKCGIPIGRIVSTIDKTIDDINKGKVKELKR